MFNWKKSEILFNELSSLSEVRCIVLFEKKKRKDHIELEIYLRISIAINPTIIVEKKSSLNDILSFC